MDTKKLARKALLSAAFIFAVAGLSACGDKEKKPGQAIASVNGEEITVMQLNEELQRANVQAAQQTAASKQLLEALIDRQLLQNEAAKDKTDRDPKVVQAIERAKALIVAQAYMQKRLGAVAKPTAAEVADYYQKNPHFFADRKQFDMKQLVIDTKDLTPDLKAAADAAKSLEDVAAWMDTHKVKYARNQVSRTSSDLAPEMTRKLIGMPKGQLFIVKEGERSMFISIADMKDSPASLEIAGPQIEKFLFTKKNKEAADAELARLRAAAKIEYLNKTDTLAAAPAAGAPAVTPAAAVAPAPTAADSDAAAAARGVAGLK